MELVPGWWSWMEWTNKWRKRWRKPKRTTSMTLTMVQGNLLVKQDRNNHHCRRLLLQQLRCHLICVSWATLYQISTTVSKCQKRWSDCSDPIVQYVKKKTDQSNSEPWHWCFVQNSPLFSSSQFEHAWITCKKKREPKQRFQFCGGFILCWCRSVPSNKSRPRWRKTHWSHNADQSVVTERLRRAHLPRTPSFNQDWSWVAKTSRKEDMRCSSRSWTKCSSINTKKGIKTKIEMCKQSWKIQQNTVYWCNLRVTQSKVLQFYQTRSSFTLLYLRCASGMWLSGKSGEEFCRRTYQSPVLPRRIALKPNMHYARQITTSSDAENVFRRFYQAQGGLWRWNVQRKWSRWNRLQDPKIAPFDCPRTRSHP